MAKKNFYFFIKSDIYWTVPYFEERGGRFKNGMIEQFTLMFAFLLFCLILMYATFKMGEAFF